MHEYVIRDDCRGVHNKNKYLICKHCGHSKEYADTFKPLCPANIYLPGIEWIDAKKIPPPTTEPIVYARPDTKRGPGRWHIGIGYWTVSDTWNPEMESQQNPTGFTHWIPLPKSPRI